MSLTKSSNKLTELKKFTTIVADTSDFASISIYKPTDTTTNPSLIYKASQDPKYSYLIDEAISSYSKSSNKLSPIIDEIYVRFGCEILKTIPGRVSIEVDARLSFDVNGSIQKAKNIISLFEKNNISRDRILIKLAATWESILAAKKLEEENIHCNMTLIFSLTQAIACGDAKATLISPFVGRILDWYKKNEQKDFSSTEDPGVLSVSSIYNYYKKFGIKTEVMGASFRNKEEIFELAGCDLLTISPQLLDEIQKSDGTIERKLDPKTAKLLPIEKKEIDEKAFRFFLNEDQMATEKLSEGIRIFVKDIRALEKLICSKF
jgi:transaldolase